MKNSQKIRIALLQFAAPDGAVFKNYEVLKGLLKKLKKPVDVILLPEMWPSGFRIKEGTLLARQTLMVLEEMKRYAKKRGVYIVGSSLEKVKRGYCNTATIITPKGRVSGRYRKVHLFQLGGEDKKFLSGDKAVVVKTSLGKIGLAICYDIRFPELIRKEVLAGAQMILVPSAWPAERIDHYHSLLKARAIENLCFVASANKIGENALRMVYGGQSIAFDPWGRLLGQLGKRAGILYVTFDLAELQRIRKSFPVFEARREKVYGYLHQTVMSAG